MIKVLIAAILIFLAYKIGKFIGYCKCNYIFFKRISNPNSKALDGLVETLYNRIKKQVEKNKDKKL